MTDYPDQPDYQQAVTPGVTRWAPGTEFGAVAWNGSVAANTEHQVNYAIPNDGCRYVVDKSVVSSNYVGVLPVFIDVCLDYGTPVWVRIAGGYGDGIVELAPFAFISMSIRYPQALRWRIFNNNNVSRNFELVANLYKYLATG